MLYLLYIGARALDTHAAETMNTDWPLDPHLADFVKDQFSIPQNINSTNRFDLESNKLLVYIIFLADLIRHSLKIQSDLSCVEFNA